MRAYPGLASALGQDPASRCPLACTHAAFLTVATEVIYIYVHLFMYHAPSEAVLVRTPLRGPSTPHRPHHLLGGLGEFMFLLYMLHWFDLGAYSSRVPWQSKEGVYFIG